MISGELHEELAAFYRQFRGVPAPVNSVTEGIWDQIALWEAEEGVHG